MQERKSNINKIILLSDGSFCNDMTKVFFTKPGDTIRPSLSSTKFKTKVPVLLTNVDLNKKCRSKYLNMLEIRDACQLSRDLINERYDCKFGTFDQEGTWSCDIVMPGPGSYFMQVIFVEPNEFEKSDTINITDFGRPEWIVVECELSINGVPISAKQLSMQSLLSRSMGCLDRWDDLIKMQTSLGYNAFHLTPFQKLGGSESLYAIADQLDIAEFVLPPNEDKEANFRILRDKVLDLAKKYGCIFFAEVVLNHTSFDSEWIQTLPEACYNLKNTPQLNSGYVLDCALQEFSRKIEAGGIPEYSKDTIETEEDLHNICWLLEDHVIKPLNLQEFFLIDIKKYHGLFIDYMTKNHPDLKNDESSGDGSEDPEQLKELITTIEQNLKNLGVSKYGVEVDLESTAKYFVSHPVKNFGKQFEAALNKLNEQLEGVAQGYLSEAVKHIGDQNRYLRLQKGEHKVTFEKPIADAYFNHLKDGTAVANNGWIFFGDPTQDFAVSNWFFYLRRGIVIWTDLIKLRFGQSKKDCPELWKRMKRYVQQAAEAFGGLRLDNAHTTPIHVAEYLVRKGRKINPNLFVFSELFSGSDERDALFTKRIAVNSLVREAINSSTPHEMAQYINKHSEVADVSVGSLDPYSEIDPKTGREIYLLKPRNPDALLCDFTHDNMSYNERRTFRDSLPTAALVAMSNCFVASCKGFDEFFPHNLSVIKEYRIYPVIENPLEGQVVETESTKETFIFHADPNAQHVEVIGSWDEWAQAITLQKTEHGAFKATVDLPAGTHFYKYIVDGNWTLDNTKPMIREGDAENNSLLVEAEVKRYSNMWPVRLELNKIHKKISKTYPELMINEIVYKETSDILTVSRENIRKTKSYFLITRSAFTNNQDSNDEVDVTIQLPGRIEQFVLIAYAESNIVNIPEDTKYTRGIEANVIITPDISKFGDIIYDPKTQSNSIKFFNMPPSFVCIVHVILNLDQMLAVRELEALKGIDRVKLAKEISAKLTPTDINYLLFSCEPEERDRTHGAHGTYTLSHSGKLAYAGFGTFMTMLKEAQFNNDLSLPLFDDLRQRDSLLDFLIKRVESNAHYRNLFSWLTKYFNYLRIIPRHLIPKYFTRIMNLLSWVFIHKINATQNLDQNLETTHFFKRLILGCYQFIGEVPSASIENLKTTIAAGLPILCVGRDRCWGRDTFVSFKGILLVPGLYEIAKNTILAFATLLRNGLLPNILEGGKNPRYNCRDSVWWFIKGVKDYIEFTKDHSILKQEIHLRHTGEQDKSKALTLADAIHSIFQQHAQGIKYAQDDTDIDLRLDEATGFIFGGSGHNELTWMDSSKTKGNHSLSRDGAPIELTALLKCCLDFVISAGEQGHFVNKGVEIKGGTLSYRDWADRIKSNFESNYWIPSDESQFKQHKINPESVRRRGIYKDTLGSKDEENDYYFRPNGCVAIALAPDLFSKENASMYLRTVEELLIKEHSLGVKTLDPEEKIYVASCDSFGNVATDTTDESKHAGGGSTTDELDKYLETSAEEIGKQGLEIGENYHKGLEWVWLYGDYLKALLNVDLKDLNMVTFMSHLTNHKLFIQKNEWASLPNATNNNGQPSKLSCPAQAWSIATINEAIYDAQRMLK